MKWLLYFILALLMIPLVVGTEDCKGIMKATEIPCSVISSWQFAPCDAENISIYNESPALLDRITLDDYGVSGRCNITFNYTKHGSYLLNWSTGDSAKIIVEEDVQMASLSVVLFFSAITFFVFWIGIKSNFSKNPVANLIFKRCLIIFGLLLLSLDTTMVVTIANTAGLGIAQEIFRYLWIINWSIYLFMLYLVWTTVTNTLKMWEKLAKQKRMGEDEQDFD